MLGFLHFERLQEHSGELGRVALGLRSRQAPERTETLDVT